MNRPFKEVFHNHVPPCSVPALQSKGIYVDYILDIILHKQNVGFLFNIILNNKYRKFLLSAEMDTFVRVLVHRREEEDIKWPDRIVESERDGEKIFASYTMGEKNVAQLDMQRIQ